MKKNVLLPILLLLTSLNLAAAEVKWQVYSADVFAQAEAENKLILVDLAAEWCAYCKKMDATTWQDKAVLDIIDKSYIPVRIQDELQPVLAERFRAYGRPAAIIFDAEGEEIVTKKGYLKPQWMLWMLQAVAEENTVASN